MKKTRWRKAEKQVGDPTATAAGNALTQLQLRLRLLASPKSRPAAETLGTRSTPRPPPPSPTPQSPGFENALSAPRGPTSGLLARSRSPAGGPREPHFRPFTARPPCQAPSTALPFRGTRHGHQPVRTLTRREPTRQTPAGLGLARVLLGNGPSSAAARPLLLRLVPPSRTSGAPADGPGRAACGAAEAKEMGIPPRRSRSGCLLWGSGCVFEETGSPW